MMRKSGVELTEQYIKMLKGEVVICPDCGAEMVLFEEKYRCPDCDG